MMLYPYSPSSLYLFNPHLSAMILFLFSSFSPKHPTFFRFRSSCIGQTERPTRHWNHFGLASVRGQQVAAAAAASNGQTTRRRTKRRFVNDRSLRRCENDVVACRHRHRRGQKICFATFIWISLGRKFLWDWRDRLKLSKSCFFFSCSNRLRRWQSGSVCWLESQRSEFESHFRGVEIKKNETPSTVGMLLDCITYPE